MTTQKINMDELETQVNSPERQEKRGINGMKVCTFGVPCLVLNEVVPCSQMSQTQTEIYARDVVRDVMMASKNNTIKHQISKISKNSQLYAKPLARNSNEFRFDSIPPSNSQYTSSSSAKIKEINHGLHSRPRTPSTAASVRYQSENCKQNSSMIVQKRKPRVSVSGLVTYKFHSVNAERSIGSNLINHEQKLSQALKQSHRARQCQGNRFKKILFKNSRIHYKEHIRKQQKIMSDFNCSTDEYISKIQEQNENQQLIYGEKFKKLNFVKDYMVSEGTNYAEGRFIIDQIDKFQSDKEPIQERICIKTEPNEDIVFEHRRLPVYRKKIHVRHLTFVE